MRLTVIDWGLTAYPEALARMRELVASRLRGEVGDLLLLCEHEAVITVGRRLGAAENVRDAGGVPVVEVERGGDVTYHGPGQQVVYPIALLKEGERDLHRYLRKLEQLAIEVLARFGIEGGRGGPTGVWVGEKKIASIGVAARRWVVFHGLALNVSLDLGAFTRIRPCGLAPEVMTSMARELGAPPAIGEVKAALVEVARRLFGE